MEELLDLPISQRKQKYVFLHKSSQVLNVGLNLGEKTLGQLKQGYRQNVVRHSYNGTTHTPHAGQSQGGCTSEESSLFRQGWWDFAVSFIGHLAEVRLQHSHQRDSSCSFSFSGS